MNKLVAAALTMNQEFLSLGNEVFQADGGRFIRSVAAPGVYDTNLVDTVTAASPQEIEALLARAEREYVRCSHLRFDVDPRTPPEFEAHLRLDSAWSCTEMLVLILEDELRTQPAPFEIREIVDAAGWEALNALHARDWLESVADEEDVGAAIAGGMRRKSPPARFWLGFVDGVPRGYLSSWEGTGGVGQVETLFVQPEIRHRGLATALLAHGVRDCRSHGAGPVVIATAVDDTPKHMYAALGWRPVAVKRNYRRTRQIEQPL